MIVLYPIHQIRFLMLVYHPFILKIRIFLRLYAPLTTKLMVICIRLLLKICDSSIVRPLSIIFKKCLQTGTFPNNWKKSNVLPIHEKVNKHLLKTNAQSRCYQYVLKFSKELSSTQCLNFLKKIISSVHTNGDFVHLTHVKASYYPLFMKSMLVLIKFLPLK